MRTPLEDIYKLAQLTFESFEVEGEDKPFRARVSVHGAKASVVARYYCVIEFEKNNFYDLGDQLDDLEFEHKASSIYIFVKDPNNPLVPIERPVVKAFPYEEIVIPCKPSSKNVKVELFKDEQEIPLDDYIFSEHYGFALMAYQEDQSGKYVCRAKDDLTKVIHFHVEEVMTVDDLEYLPKPRVESKGNDHTTLGESIKLSCNLVVRNGVKFDMRWILPDRKKAENNSRVAVSGISVQNHSQRSNYMIGTMDLLIAHSTESDAGIYKCEVEDMATENTNHKNHRMIITNASFIDIKDDRSRPFIVASTNRPVQVIFSYEANAPPQFYWIKDDDHKPLQVGEKYNITITPKSVTLTIFKPSVRDIGNYTVFASYDGVKANRSMKVFIQEKPILTMDSRYARPEEPVTFSCTALGYPKPDMRLEFFPCPSVPWTNCSRPVPSKDIKNSGLRINRCWSIQLRNSLPSMRKLPGL
ncbi:vascular endothelial growth factor receptor 1-like [Uranotaenia lowii]|uniref:vascular endothelial growth factor receptor 1-like n=1 Tax=Uranotaenia lowii TaxID=190385 RepID=UPI0024792A0A|nr:vascular endothelial growth factor receptor 1-like [Uranotaenia lowii]